MEINGRTVGLLLSVGAEQEIARLCQGDDLRKLGPMLQSRNAESIAGCAELVCILSRWHEKARAFEQGPDYEQRPLSREEVELLPDGVFRALLEEALASMARDQQQTVEAAPAKKDEAPKSS